MRLLLIDNYDSFTFNLADLLQRAAAECRLPVRLEVARNDAISLAAAGRFDAVVLSPGPNAPSDAGICLPLIGELLGRIPIFGVCLGHQAIAQALGGRIVRAKRPVHGKASAIRHLGTGVLAGLPPRFAAMRYHSLVVDAGSLDARVAINAWLGGDRRVVMGLHSDALRVAGVQFHPESVGTPLGLTIAVNTLRWFAQCQPFSLLEPGYAA